MNNKCITEKEFNMLVEEMIYFKHRVGEAKNMLDTVYQINYDFFNNKDNATMVKKYSDAFNRLYEKLDDVIELAGGINMSSYKNFKLDSVIDFKDGRISSLIKTIFGECSK